MLFDGHLWRLMIDDLRWFIDVYYIIFYNHPQNNYIKKSFLREVIDDILYIFNTYLIHSSYPIGSMYGIYFNIWGILMVNVTIYGSTMPWIIWVIHI